MNLCVKLCIQISPKVVVKNNYELNQYLEKLLSNMMEKIGDNNARLREKTEEAALAMA